MFNKFLISSLNKDLATSKLINFRFYKIIFMIIISIIVSVAIKWVGILLINSLLTLPAAAAKNISKSMKQYMILSLFFSIVSGVLGFAISYFLGSSSAPVIVLFSSIIYVFSHISKKLELLKLNKKISPAAPENFFILLNKFATLVLFRF